MTSPVPQVSPWRSRAMWLAVAFAFFAQIGLIFWLGDKGPIPVRAPAAVPALRLGAECGSEFLTLNDPTLFALPHRESFSGAAWLTSWTPSAAVFDWTEAPWWLALSVEPLGPRAGRLVETNGAAGWDSLAMPEPQLTLPKVSPPAIQQTSLAHLEGELARWRLANPLDLPSWPARRVSATDTDLLTNSVVQLVIDGEGKPISVTLLTSSGDAAADQFAMDQARVARFEPPARQGSEVVSNTLARLRWGRLIFEWHTVPATNSPGPP